MKDNEIFQSDNEVFVLKYTNGITETEFKRVFFDLSKLKHFMIKHNIDNDKIISLLKVNHLSIAKSYDYSERE